MWDDDRDSIAPTRRTDNRIWPRYPGHGIRVSMSPDIDDKIKQLFTEADRATPEPPNLPVLTRPAVNWWRVAVAPAAAVLILFAGTVAVLNAMGVEFGLGFAASGDAEEGAVPDDSGFVLALADLNLACSEFGTAMDDAGSVTDDASVVVWLETIHPALRTFGAEVGRAAARFPTNEALAGVASRLDGLEEDVSSAITSGNPTMGTYRLTVAAIEDAATALSAVGALGCSDLT